MRSIELLEPFERLRVLACIALMVAFTTLSGCASSVTSTRGEADPVASDPVTFDQDYPAELLAFVATSSGESLNGRGLLAQGKGPHPTVLLLHGLPGNELNLDLAQSIRRAGWNVFTFHYRGSWGSGGEYSFPHVLEDTHAVLVFLRAKAGDPKWRIDPERIVLVGHSVGGFAALRVGAEDPGIRSIASISGFDLGLAGQTAAAQPQARQFWSNFLKTSTSLRIGDADTLMNEWLAQAPRWQLPGLADGLARKNVLLVSGTRDTVAVPARHHAPLAQALRASGSSTLTEVSLDSDHSYSDRRIALTRAVLDWLVKQR